MPVLSIPINMSRTSVPDVFATPQGTGWEVRYTFLGAQSEGSVKHFWAKSHPELLHRPGKKIVISGHSVNSSLVHLSSRNFARNSKNDSVGKTLQ